MISLLNKQFINAAYNTRGNELCKYVRAEVMEVIEEKDLTSDCTKDDYNDIVANIMNRINTIIKQMIEIEVDNI